MSQRFDGKVAFITGAARGIGWATAEEFLRRGWSVTIGDVNAAAAERRAEDYPDQVLALRLDVPVRDGLSVLSFDDHGDPSIGPSLGA